VDFSGISIDLIAFSHIIRRRQNKKALLLPYSIPYITNGPLETTPLAQIEAKILLWRGSPQKIVADSGISY